MNEDVEQDAWLSVIEYLKKAGQPLPAARTREELQRAYHHVLPLVSQFKRYERIRAYQRMNTQKRSKEKTCSLDQVGDIAYSMDEFTQIEDDATLFECVAHYNKRTRDGIQYFIRLWCRQQSGEEINKADRQKLVRIRRETGLPLILERKNYTTRRKNLSKDM